MSAQSNSAVSSNSDDVKCRVAEPSTMTLYCGFCGKSNDEVNCLVAGPSAFICDECTFTCSEIVEGFRIRKIIDREVEEALEARALSEGPVPEGQSGRKVLEDGSCDHEFISESGEPAWCMICEQPAPDSWHEAQDAFYDTNGEA